MIFTTSPEIISLSSSFMFILLVLFAILVRLSSLSFAPDRVFRRRRSAIIARPLGRPQTATRRRISPFLSFFRHFHRGNRTHPTWTRIFSNSFPTFADTAWPPLGKQMATHVSRRTSLHSDITSEIMCRHFLYPHLTPGKPIFHPGHFSFKIQTCTYLTSAKKLVYQNRISQISGRYPIWIPLAKSLSV